MDGQPWTERDLGARIVGTLELMASRRYNPDVERLASMMLGGGVPAERVVREVEDLDGVGVDDGFVFVEGKSFVEACRHRVDANGRMGPLYHRIAGEYARDLVGVCPWVRCVMLVGSAATGGVCEGDDVDLNLVVDDGRKYSTNLLGSLLNRRYSLRYAGPTKARRKDHYLIPPVMCLNIIWERSQVLPLRRRDEQVAYEMFSGVVLHGGGFFRRMLAANAWLEDYFPQVFDGAEPGDGGPMEDGRAGVGVMERLSRGGLFAYRRVMRTLLSRREEVVRRMDLWEEVKRPYGLYDRPEEEDELWG